MAQRIVTLCDVHARNDEDMAGATWEVTLTGPGQKATTWEVDLCEDDAKTLGDLAVMLDAVGRVTHGRRTKAPTAPRKAASGPGQAHTAPAPRYGGGTPIEGRQDEAGNYPCPVEGCGKVPSTRKALMSHLRQYHEGMSMAEAYGEPLPYGCPDCDKRFSHATGLGAHRRAAHGVASDRASA
jgi:hypothetical protein